MSDEHRGLPHDMPEYVPNVPPEPEEPAEVFQVLIHGAVWNDFRDWLDQRGIKLTPPMQFSADDMPTYVMTPKKLQSGGAMSEETVKVDLGDDYYQGAYFRTVDGPLDYEVPKSTLERWEAAQAAYGAMQDEVEQVMQEQGNRVLALMLERRKDQPSTLSPIVQAAYEDAITRMLQQAPLLRRKEGE